MPDQDHYPTDEELARIEKWDTSDAQSRQKFMAFVRSCWWMPDWGFQQTGDRYDLSTGGWSGNEEIIGAMQENFLFWGQCWESSRKGGHYVFIL